MPAGLEKTYSILDRLKRSKLAVTTIAWTMAGSEIVQYHDTDRDYCGILFLGACAVSCLYLFSQGRVAEITAKHDDRAS